MSAMSSAGSAWPCAGANAWTAHGSEDASGKTFSSAALGSPKPSAFHVDASKRVTPCALSRPVSISAARMRCTVAASAHTYAPTGIPPPDDDEGAS